MFSPLLRPCPRWMSRVKPPQVLSHLLLVVTVFALLHPMCQINFLGQTPTSPISSAFCGVPYVLNIVGTHEIRFKDTHEISFPGRKLSTSYLSWENGKSHEQSHHNPGKSWNIQWTPGRIPERKNIRTSWNFPRKPLEIPGESLAHLWKIWENHVKIFRN